MLTPQGTRRLWLPEEDRIVGRYAQALVAGRYRSQRDASAVCIAELDRLYARIRKLAPSHAVAATGRTEAMVRVRMRQLLGRRGLVWGGSGLLEAERKAVRRHATALARGRFPDALRAAEACQAEIARLPRGVRALKPRALHTIHVAILDEAHRLRRSWPCAHWRNEEDRVVRRYARALASGRYADPGAAVRDCVHALAKLPRPRVGGYPTRATRKRLVNWANEAGWVSHLAPWSPAAQRVLRSYLRRLYSGEYRTVPAAAVECTRELRRLAATTETGRRVRTDVVHRELARQAKRLRLPRHRTFWHPGELRIVEAYARRVGRGDFSGWHKAAVACREELQSFWVQAVLNSPVAVRLPAGRGIPGIHARMLVLAHELGLPGPDHRVWTAREDRVVASWVRWYDRYRTPWKRGPLGVAADGIQEELEQKGFRRTRSACRDKVKKGWLRLHGLA